MLRSKQYLFPPTKTYINPETLAWVREHYGQRSVSKTVQRALDEFIQRQTRKWQRRS